MLVRFRYNYSIIDVYLGRYMLFDSFLNAVVPIFRLDQLGRGEDVRRIRGQQRPRQWAWTLVSGQP